MTTITYADQTFDVPANYRERGYTHALCGTHQYRGPEVLRWMKGALVRTEEQREVAIAGVRRLYGSAMHLVELVPIDPPPRKRGSSVREAA